VMIRISPKNGMIFNMKENKGKIDPVFIILLLIILITLLFVLAPQNISINDPRFMVQYWSNITTAVRDVGRSLSSAFESLFQGITGFITGIRLR
jgi:hypothetical protein